MTAYLEMLADRPVEEFLEPMDIGISEKVYVARSTDDKFKAATVKFKPDVINLNSNEDRDR